MPEYKNNAGQGRRPQKSNKAFNFIRLVIFWGLLVLMGAAIISALSGDTKQVEERSLTAVLT